MSRERFLPNDVWLREGAFVAAIAFRPGHADGAAPRKFAGKGAVKAGPGLRPMHRRAFNEVDFEEAAHIL
jgi:hypothetical protein